MLTPLGLTLKVHMHIFPAGKDTPGYPENFPGLCPEAFDQASPTSVL